jgi:hypothetical protein
MKSSKRIRVATALTAVVAAVSMVSPAPASASGCTGKFTEQCQEIENLICHLFGKCF